ncbi:MAG TPA: hypothetical protein VN282_07215 [Pyrinomonadaceae bacterium]|nr:hypothetical protein [Pyrinomonadaceae bacterium]
MSSNPETQRVDMLLALALAFGEAGAGTPGASASGGAASTGESNVSDPLAPLAALPPATRQAVARRAEWLAKLPAQSQHDWVAHMLARARGPVPRFDERVHPSHVAEQLRGEPPRVRELVLSYLPGRVAEEVAAQPGASLRVPSPEAAPVAPEVIAVVRREFLARFEPEPDATRARPLDLLSGAGLARLVRVLGVREAANACRRLESREAVASFLRRFEPEDFQAVRAHLYAPAEVAPARLRFAEEVMRDALLAGAEPGAMLDLVGLRMLANSFDAGADSSRLRYAAQKLPLEAARLLSEMAREGLARFVEREAEAAELRRALARETEAAAAGLYGGGVARA